MIPAFVLALVVVVVFAVAISFAVTALHFRARNARKAHLRHVLEARWKPLLLPVLAGDDPTGLLASVARSERLFFIDFLFSYAKRFHGREREILRNTVSPFLPLLVARLGSEADPAQRARAVRTVGLLGGSQHLPELLSALDDPSPVVAITAARALALRGHPEFIPLLLDRAERFREWSPRFFASLLASAGPDAGPPLRTALADGGHDTWIRRVAADALAELDDLPAAAVAAAVLGETDDRDLRCACLRLLERVGTTSEVIAVRPLIHAVDPMVRLCAIAAIGELGDRQDLPALRSSLEDRDQWIALNATRALRKLGDEAWLWSMAERDEPRSSLAVQVLHESLA